MQNKPASTQLHPAPPGVVTIDETTTTPQPIQMAEQIFGELKPAQIEQIAELMVSLEDYLKMVAVDIRHQEKSISSLPPLLRQVPEITQRVENLILKAKTNIEFINLLTQHYKPLLARQRKPEHLHSVPPSHPHQPHHDHIHQNHTTIMNIFYHLVSEWSEHAQIEHIQLIAGLAQKYLPLGHEDKSSQLTAAKVLVVGCGTGRILLELEDSLHNVAFQGHETSTELFLCADYFLRRCRQQSQIYPYIHNFSNCRSSEDALRAVTVPAPLRRAELPLTLGKFSRVYRGQRSEWKMVVTVYHNYHMEDALGLVRMVEELLEEGGVWIDVCTADFQANTVELSYREYENILTHSHFKLLQSGSASHYWFYDHRSLVNERRTTYFRVMQK